MRLSKGNKNLAFDCAYYNDAKMWKNYIFSSFSGKWIYIVWALDECYLKREFLCTMTYVTINQKGNFKVNAFCVDIKLEKSFFFWTIQEFWFDC